MKRKKKNSEEGADWMSTYGDMVTLLLCFFVLLYSISSVDQQKWENFVKSMNPEASKVSQIVTDTKKPADGNHDVPGANATKTDQEFDKMYGNLQDLAKKMGKDSEIKVAKGDGYAFITFRDKVFFDGDSAVLRKEGKTVLDGFAKAVKPATDAVREIQVIGHTSQADPNVRNEILTDRILSAERSARVVSYIQEKNVVNPSKLASSAYGQWRPIASFKTSSDRAKNRRVEMLITKSGSAEKSLQEYYSQVYK